MKSVLTFLFSCLTFCAFAYQDTTATMPPEETRPTSYWWWAIGVVITLAVGITVYRLIKKDPRKDG